MEEDTSRNKLLSMLSFFINKYFLTIGNLFCKQDLVYQWVLTRNRATVKYFMQNAAFRKMLI